MLHVSGCIVELSWVVDRALFGLMVSRCLGCMGPRWDLLRLPLSLTCRYPRRAPHRCSLVFRSRHLRSRWAIMCYRRRSTLLGFRTWCFRRALLCSRCPLVLVPLMCSRHALLCSRCRLFLLHWLHLHCPSVRLT
jgi:hypothetical protein